MNMMKFLFFCVVAVYLHAASFAAEKSEYIPACLEPKDRESYARMLNYSIGSHVNLMYSVKMINVEECKKDAEEIQDAGYLNMPKDKLQSMLQCDLGELLERSRQDFVMWKIGREAILNEVAISAHQWLYDELTNRNYDQSANVKETYTARLKKLTQKVFPRDDRTQRILSDFGLRGDCQTGNHEAEEARKILTMRKVCNRALFKYIGQCEDNPSIGQEVFVTLTLLDKHIPDNETRSMKGLAPCDNFHEFKDNMLQALLTTLVDEDGDIQRKHLAHIMHIVTIRTSTPIDPLRLRQTWFNAPGKTITTVLPLGPCVDMFETKLDMTEIEKIRDAYNNGTDYGFFTAKDAVRSVVCDEFYAQEAQPIDVVHLLCGKKATSATHNNIAILLKECVQDFIEIYKLAATDSAQKTVKRYEAYQNVIQQYISDMTTEND